MMRWWRLWRGWWWWWWLWCLWAWSSSTPSLQFAKAGFVTPKMVMVSVMVMVTQTRSGTKMTPTRIMMIFWRHHCLGHDRSHGPHPLPLHVGRCDVRQVLQLRQNHPHIVIAVFIEKGVFNTVMIWNVVSGSQDKTVRFWDLRTRGCVNVVSYQV